MKLAEWLAATGTSQSALARRLKVSQGRISQIVAGDAPSLELALLIATATGGKVRPETFKDTEMTRDNSLDTVEDAVAAIARGEMVVVVDDDDRENEGDLIGAAGKITPDQMAFMVRHTSGIVCTPMSADVARRLKLDPMVALNDAPMGTAFTVTVDYKVGLTTGISARERVATCHALANGNVQAINYFVAQKYVEALKALATSPNQKVLMMPLETTGLLGSIAGIAELSKGALDKGAGALKAPKLPGA